MDLTSAHTESNFRYRNCEDEPLHYGTSCNLRSQSARLALNARPTPPMYKTKLRLLPRIPNLFLKIKRVDRCKYRRLLNKSNGTSWARSLVITLPYLKTSWSRSTTLSKDRSSAARGSDKNANNFGNQISRNKTRLFSELLTQVFTPQRPRPHISSLPPWAWPTSPSPPLLTQASKWMSPIPST